MLLFIINAQEIAVHQNEGIGNLMAIALLALCVVSLFIVAIKIKNKRRQPEEQEINDEKAIKVTSEKNLIK